MIRISGTTYQDMDLLTIIQKAAKEPTDAAIFNNAAQHFNHSFFWECMVSVFFASSCARTVAH
jgi:Fe-Mn family superoxide dismutase